MFDLKEWVRTAPDEHSRRFRKAIHTIVIAMAEAKELSAISFLKGGILLAIRYQSPRYTTDIDYSTPEPYTPEAAERIRKRLAQGLATAMERLGYEIDCRIHSWKINPHPKPEWKHHWVTLQIRVGYAPLGTPAHARLIRGQAPEVVELDYSFDESVPTEEVLQLEGDRTLHIYGLSTLIAEKYRALLQQGMRNRTRRQDIYDINFLLGTFDVEDKFQLNEIIETLKVKTKDREVPFSRDSMSDPVVYEKAKSEYQQLAKELEEGALPDFEESFDRVKAFYESLPWE